MSVSPAPDPMESLFTLSPDEQRVFTLDAPPRTSETMEAPTPVDVAGEAAPFAAGDKKAGGEGILEVVAEGTPDLLEFVFSDVLGSLLEWLE